MPDDCRDRRSHGLAYRPACPGCNACVPVRIAASEFDYTKSFRRVLKANADLSADDIEAIATVEHLLAACAGIGVDNLLIEIDGPEVPIMDGSSAVYC